jgi:hypothetical protein
MQIIRRKALEVERPALRSSSALLATLLLAWACGSQPADATPDGALSSFLQALDRGAHDPEELREAYRLLDRRARDALRTRARKAETLAGGRHFEPWDMLAQGRFRLRFTPASRDSMQTRIDGDRAVVTVRGRSSQKRAEVQMVRESGGWRVMLDVPEMQSTFTASADAGR